MPLIERGPKTLWFSCGVFLFICILVIVFPASTLPLAVFFPALYYTQTIRCPQTRMPYIAMLPAVLILIPQLRWGALLYLLISMTAVLMAYCIRRKHLGLSVFIPTMLTTALFTVFALQTAGIEGIGIRELSASWVSDMLDQLSHVYEQVLTGEQVNEFRMQKYLLQQRLTRILPAMIISSFAFIFWFNLILIASLDRRIMLRTWKCPDQVLIVFIAAGLLFALPLGRTASDVGINLLITVLHVYFFQGMGIMSTLAHHQKWGIFFKWILYILIFTQIYIMVIISAIGLFDTWFDFRSKTGNTKGDK